MQAVASGVGRPPQPRVSSIRSDLCASPLFRLPAYSSTAWFVSSACYPSPSPVSRLWQNIGQVCIWDNVPERT